MKENKTTVNNVRQSEINKNTERKKRKNLSRHAERETTCKFRKFEQNHISFTAQQSCTQSSNRREKKKEDARLKLRYYILYSTTIQTEIENE